MAGAVGIVFGLCVLSFTLGAALMYVLVRRREDAASDDAAEPAIPATPDERSWVAKPATVEPVDDDYDTRPIHRNPVMGLPQLEPALAVLAEPVARPRPAAELKLVAQPKPVAQPEPVADSRPVAQHKPVADLSSVAAPEVAAESEPVAEPEAVAEPRSAVPPRSAVRPESVAELEPVAMPDPVAMPKPVAMPDPVAMPEPVAQPKPVAERGPAPEPEALSQPGTVGAAGYDWDGDLDPPLGEPEAPEPTVAASTDTPQLPPPASPQPVEHTTWVEREDFRQRYLRTFEEVRRKAGTN